MVTWLADAELRVGLGCMRLSTDADRDDARGRATLEAALECGITVFDTAHAYGLDDADCGHNEALLGRVLRGRPSVRVVTKGGMRRPNGRWVPDGRAAALRRDCEASLVALAGLPIDLYLVHAPDSRVEWSTTVRALRGLLDEGLVRRVGVCNVNRSQLDVALDLAPVAAVQVALSLLDDSALASGVVARCLERGVTVLAHSPLGGVKKAQALLRAPGVVELARRRGCSEAQVALAALLHLSPSIVPLPGARRPETARDAAGAVNVKLESSDIAGLGARVQAPTAAVGDGTGEVVLVMGVQGSGKTASVEQWVARGFTRLNRDEAGGTLKQLAARLEALLGSGTRRVVLDNTFVTRAARRDFLEAAARRGVPVRGVWLETPLAQAQVNVVLRMLHAHGRLLDADELRRGKGPTTLPPNALFRMSRETEEPSLGEGFTTLERVPFVRRPWSNATHAARFISLDAVLDELGAPTPSAAEVLKGDELTLVYGWRPALTAEGRSAIEAALRALAPSVEVAVCTHRSGPPVCWCRPPLPGLLLAFALRHRVDLDRSILIGQGAAHRALADALGIRLNAPG